MVRAVASVFGVSFLAVGVLGFLLNPTGGELLGIFAVNVLHNLVHLLFGIFGIAAVLVGRSRIYLQGVGVIYLLLTVLGFIPGLFVGDEMLLGLVHINLADNFLHLVLGGAAAFFGFAPQYRGQVSRGTGEVRVMEPFSGNPRILSAATAVPPHRVGQEEIKGFARNLFAGKFRDLERFLPIFDNGRIETRHFCQPLGWYGREWSFPERNALYVEHALELSRKAARRCLDRAGVQPEDVGALFFVSTTGLSTPSLDAKLLFRLGLSPNLRRIPIWGLGCVGGAAGVARAVDHARSHPEELVLVIAVELCSLTFQAGDASKSNLIAASLFADGAAAVLIGAGDEGPEVLGSHSTTWPNTEDVMGWDLIETGLKVRFAKSVPQIVRARTRATLEEACEKHGLELGDLRHFVVHPGGAKVLEAYEEALGLESGSLDLSREVLREHGNMSSVSVLFVLEQFLDEYQVRNKEYGTISALGPGFSAEHVLFRC